MGRLQKLYSFQLDYHGGLDENVGAKIAYIESSEIHSDGKLFIKPQLGLTQNKSIRFLIHTFEEAMAQLVVNVVDQSNELLS